ncbi:MAG: hypothetical protein HZB39_14165 [Planctomycetes bacterium]|nr:hypothetical protein [Planctomycetota bacterium]
MNHAAIRDRLTELEKQRKLEKLLAKDDAGLSWADMAWLLQIPAFCGVAIHVVRIGLAASGGQEPPAEDLAWALLLALIAVVLHRGWPMFRTRAERLGHRLRRAGVVVPAAIVQVNHAHFADDNREWHPGSILLSFDPLAAAHPQRLSDAAQRIFALRELDRRTLPAEQVVLAWDLYHSMWPVKSSPVPAELCDGLRDCVLATVMLPPEPLEDGGALAALALPRDLSPDAVRVLPGEVC